jgi:hypothetical protein
MSHLILARHITRVYGAGIFKQIYGGQEPSRNRVVARARQATHSQPGGFGFLESILGLLKSLKIRALATHQNQDRTPNQG